MITITAIGKIASTAPEAALINHYAKQMKNLKIVEGDIRPADQNKEGDFLLKATEGMYRIILDENGKSYTSEDFAKKVKKWMDHGKIAFLIGGADGHSKAVKAAADEALSLSDLTFPHKLARVLLVEQLYRAESILKNHPYHKI